jgi:hyperosmotically inducible periplasmic protein
MRSKWMSGILVLILAISVAACGRPVRHALDDATLTTRVKTALLNDPEIGGRRIEVETVRGVVTLSGQVRSDAEEAKALQIARSVPGVAEVRSALQVVPN